MKIKVCGITSVEQVNALTNLGVDYVGFIGYEKSPRYVWDKIETGKLNSIPDINKVGVFVNENIKDVLSIAIKAGLDFIQFHGEEPLLDLKKAKENFTIIKAISIGNELNEVQSKINFYEDAVDFFLFDTMTKTYGGSGKTFDWALINHLKFKKPYFLSGGLDTDMDLKFDSLEQKPFGLDINSRFETEPGIKDLNLIKLFIQKVNAEFRKN